MSTSINQLRMNILEIQSLQTKRGYKSVIDSLIQEEKEKKITHNNKDNNNNSINYDINEITTYNEYIKYCEENAVSEYNSNPNLTFVSIAQSSATQIRPIHIDKALENCSNPNGNIFMLQTDLKT